MRVYWKSVAGLTAFATAGTAAAVAGIWWWLWRGLLPPGTPVAGCRHGCCWPDTGARHG